MDNGWISLHRKILDNPISKKPAWAWLWIVLLLKANHESNSFVWNGKKIIIERGQLLTGRKELSIQTGVSGSTIEDILKYLERQQQIRQQKTTKWRLITILNYNNYQNSNNKSNNRATTEQQQSDTNNNDNNDNNDNKKKAFSPNSNELRLSELLLSLILKRNANQKKPELQIWAKDIDKMIRIDKRDTIEIEKVILWCQSDVFWQNNILSTETLRKQYDKLYLKMNSNQTGGQSDDERFNFLKRN